MVLCRLIGQRSDRVLVKKKFLYYECLYLNVLVKIENSECILYREHVLCLCCIFVINNA